MAENCYDLRSALLKSFESHKPNTAKLIDVRRRQHAPIFDRAGVTSMWEQVKIVLDILEPCLSIQRQVECSVTDQALQHLEKTKTAFGTVTLAYLTCSYPEGNKQLHCNIVQELARNTELFAALDSALCEIATCQPQLLTYWRRETVVNKKLMNQLYWRTPGLKSFNNSAALLDIGLRLDHALSLAKLAAPFVAAGYLWAQFQRSLLIPEKIHQATQRRKQGAKQFKKLDSYLQSWGEDLTDSDLKRKRGELCDLQHLLDRCDEQIVSLQRKNNSLGIWSGSKEVMQWLFRAFHPNTFSWLSSKKEWLHSQEATKRISAGGSFAGRCALDVVHGSYMSLLPLSTYYLYCAVRDAYSRADIAHAIHEKSYAVSHFLRNVQKLRDIVQGNANVAELEVPASNARIEYLSDLASLPFFDGRTIVHAQNGASLAVHHQMNAHKDCLTEHIAFVGYLDAYLAMARYARETQV